MTRRQWVGLVCILIAAVFGAIGMGGALGWSQSTQEVAPASDNALDVPGEITLQLDESGDYGIFLEYSNLETFEAIDSISRMNQLDLVLTRTANDEEIKLRQRAIRSTYHRNGKTGVQLRSFQIEHAGEYIFSAAFKDEAAREAVLTIGPTKGERGMTKMMALLFGSCASLFLAGLLFLAGILLYLVGASKPAEGPPSAGIPGLG
jgi:hypothetical protein